MDFSPVTTFKCNTEFYGSIHLDLCLICQKERTKESLVTKKKEGRLDEIKRQLSEHHEYQTGKYTLLYDAVKDTSSGELQKSSYHYSCPKVFSRDYVYVRRAKEAV